MRSRCSCCSRYARGVTRSDPRSVPLPHVQLIGAVFGACAGDGGPDVPRHPGRGATCPWRTATASPPPDRAGSTKAIPTGCSSARAMSPLAFFNGVSTPDSTLVPSMARVRTGSPSRGQSTSESSTPAILFPPNSGAGDRTVEASTWAMGSHPRADDVGRTDVQEPRPRRRTGRRSTRRPRSRHRSRSDRLDRRPSRGRVAERHRADEHVPAPTATPRQPTGTGTSRARRRSDRRWGATLAPAPVRAALARQPTHCPDRRRSR